MVDRLGKIYAKLHDHFGPQGWWPADGPFEMVIGAILTQNTTWKNVEKAIASLKAEGLLDPMDLIKTGPDEIQRLIRPTGYFRQKTERLLAISYAIIDKWDGDLGNLFKKPASQARQELLSFKGLGPETVDSILLYAGNKPVFVVDAYSKRICERLGLIKTKDYNELQRFFESNIPVDVEVYKEFHALLVALGKEYCSSNEANMKCHLCPLEADCETGLLAQV